MPNEESLALLSFSMRPRLLLSMSCLVLSCLVNECGLVSLLVNKDVLSQLICPRGFLCLIYRSIYVPVTV